MNVTEVADRLLSELAPVQPDAAAALGGPPESIMPALGPEDFTAQRAAYDRAATALEEADVLADQSVLAAALGERLESEIALDEAGFTRSLLAPLATPVHAVREVFDRLPRDGDADWDRIAAHLGQVPTALAGYAATLRESAASGHVVARRQVLGAAAQCETWIGPDAYYERLAASRPEVAKAAETATRATAEFARFLRDELAPLARRRDGVGRELYSVTARAFLGDDVDLDETYVFGWDELSRLTAEMRAVAAEMGASSIEEAATALDADPALRLTDTDSLLRWLDQRIDETVDAIDGVHFDLPAQARRPECRITEASAGVMYYSAPDPGFTRPGRVVWAPARSTHTWRDVTTVHHEGVPGHHLQIVTALAESGLHPWQRSLAHVHGYVEGWAHYAERLCAELGLLRSPGEHLGMLYGQRWRAARIVIDLGLHLDLPIPPGRLAQALGAAGDSVAEAGRWTPEVAVAVLRAASGATEEAARFEVDRYFGWPGQALAFRIGARLWSEIRAAAERRPGFTLREFHGDALRLGPLGLRPLRDVLLAE